MLNPEEKIKRFTKTIESDAQAESERIISEMRQEIDSAVLAAEDEVLNEAFRYIKHHVALERTNTGRKVSRYMMDRKNELNARREEMSVQVMEKVRRKLADYVKTEQYYRHLLSSAEKSIKALGKHEVALCLRADDMPLAERLTEDLRKAKAVATKVTVREGAFELGGLMTVCPETHMQVDESFDTKFDELRGHFAELFGLQLSQ